MKNKTKIIAVLIALVVLAGVASAGLVGYLSNTVKTDVTVSSPMEQWNSYNGETWIKDDLSFPGEKGGQSITFYVKTENLANVAITGIGENIVTNWAGVTCNDFTVQARTDSGLGYSDWYTPTCSQGIDNWYIVFAYGPSPSTEWQVEQVDVTEIVVTFEGDADGTYIFTSQILPI